MTKYRVRFEFRNELGEMVDTYLDGNGEGLCEEDALQLARELSYQGKRNVRLEEMSVTYIYGMRLRGFSIGCQPMDGFIERYDDESGKYYDILAYDRMLSVDELEDFELDYLGEGSERNA